MPDEIVFRNELNKYVSTCPVDSDNGLLAVVDIFPVSHSRGKPAHIWGAIVIGVIVIVLVLIIL